METPRDIIRNVPFEVTRSEADGDGLTLEGYAAVFDSPTEINSYEGRFMETVERGAFAKSIAEKTPVLMFNHGQHPMIGDMPIGAITFLREENKGLLVRARLATNWLIEPVREAIAQGSISGMSFRMRVIKDTWDKPASGGDLRQRRIQEVSCPELGPVVFPAYLDTEVSVRSQEIVDALEDDNLRQELAWALLSDRADTQPYGDVAYADPGYKDDKQKRYPINTMAHAKAAWAYINMPKNQQGYTPAQVASIKSRIKAAMKKFGMTVAEDQMNAAEPDADEAREFVTALEHAIGDPAVVVDFDDSTAFYADDSDSLYQVDYTVDDEGAITVGEATLATSDEADAPPVTSEEAGSTSSEPPRHSQSVGTAVRRLERQLMARKLGVWNVRKL